MRIFAPIAEAGRSRQLPLRAAFFLVRGWLQTCAHAYAAAADYEALRHLSDAELKRRGLSRSSLAWDICQRHEQRLGDDV